MAAGPGALLPNHAPNLYDLSGSMLGTGTQSRARRGQLFDQNDSLFNFITGPGGDPTGSPLYNSFLTKARGAIGNTYDRAVMNSRANANSRGFGYASPNEQGAELGIRGQEAGALSGAPATAMQETMPYEMEAAQGRIAEGGQLTSSANNEERIGSEALIENIKQKRAAQSGLFGSLAGLAGTILGGPIGGMIGKKLGGGGGGSDEGGEIPGW